MASDGQRWASQSQRAGPQDKTGLHKSQRAQEAPREASSPGLALPRSIPTSQLQLPPVGLHQSTPRKGQLQYIQPSLQSTLIHK